MHYPRPRVLQQRFDQQIDLRPRASPGRLRGGFWRREVRVLFTTCWLPFPADGPAKTTSSANSRAVDLLLCSGELILCSGELIPCSGELIPCSAA